MYTIIRHILYTMSTISLCLLCSGLILIVHKLPIRWPSRDDKVIFPQNFISLHFTGDFRFPLQNYFTYFFIYLFTASHPANCLFYIYVLLVTFIVTFFRLT